MKSAQHLSRGQVLIIFTFAIVALIAMVGLAVDGGNILSDRRHAQNAADTAALAASLYRNTWEHSNGVCADTINTATGVLPGCAPNTVNYALNMALKNGYDNNPANQNRVDVYSPPLDPPFNNCYAGDFNCHDYIQVIINDDVNTWFARVLGIGQLHNRVAAVALAKYVPVGSLYGGQSLVALRPDGCDAFKLGGSATMTLNGGSIFVNSSATSCAFRQTNCVTFLQPPGPPPVQVVGGSSEPSGCTGGVPPVSPGTAVQFPPDPIFDTPPECNIDPKDATTDADGYTHLYPGHYASGGGGNKFPPDKNTRLDAGVYCIDSLIKTTSPLTNFVVDTSKSPYGVFIYIKPGGSFSFQGGTIQLSAPTTGLYKGYLIYVDSNFTGSPQDCTINGNGSSNYTGTIYAPYCNVTVNGDSSSTGWAVRFIAYTLQLNGNLYLNFDYNTTPPVLTPEINWTGINH